MSLANCYSTMYWIGNQLVFREITYKIKKPHSKYISFNNHNMKEDKERYINIHFYRINPPGSEARHDQRTKHVPTFTDCSLQFNLHFNFSSKVARIVVRLVFFREFNLWLCFDWPDLNFQLVLHVHPVPQVEHHLGVLYHSLNLGHHTGSRYFSAKEIQVPYYIVSNQKISSWSFYCNFKW